MTEEKIKYKGIPFVFANYNRFNGLADINLISKKVAKDSKGADITGLVKCVGGDSKGADITGLVKYVGGDSKGADITGFVKIAGGDSKGISIAGGFNYSEGVKDFLIQYGTLGNIVKEINPDNDFVLQVGLFNRIGNKYCPIINVQGMKNIPKLIKKGFGKKNIVRVKKKKSDKNKQ